VTGAHDGGGGRQYVGDGGGEWKECDGTMFGNHPLPNIEIINNQYHKF
jgi:hypothetical protein